MLDFIGNLRRKSVGFRAWEQPILSGLDETSAILEDDTRFSAACVNLIKGLTSFYFLERYLILDGVHPQKKDEIHRCFFGGLYDTVYDAYSKATGRAVVHTQFGIKTTFRAKNDERYSREELVEFYIEDRGGKRIKPREPKGPLLKIEVDENTSKKPYIAKITRVGGTYGLVRDWLVSPVECSSLEEGDIIEMQTFENQRKKRIYYIVLDGIFYAFLKRSF